MSAVTLTLTKAQALVLWEALQQYADNGHPDEMGEDDPKAAALYEVACGLVQRVEETLVPMLEGATR